jgi:drug/metabolite transporter (DMT)-like permease
MGLLAVCAVVASFVSFVLVSRWGMRTSLRPVDLAALRFAVAGTIMLPLVWRHGFLGLGVRRFSLLAVTGGLGFALLAYSGISLAPAHHGSALIHGALPLMTVFAGWLLGVGTGSARQLVGSLFVGYGVLAVGAPGIVAATMSHVVGDACLLAASLSWSIYAVLVRRWSLPTLPAAAVVASISAVIFLPGYAVWGDPQHLLAAELGDVLLQALFQGAVIGVGSIVVYTFAVRTAGPQATALAAATVPVLSTLAAIPMFDETPSIAETVGLTLIKFGVLYGATASERRT